MAEEASALNRLVHKIKKVFQGHRGASGGEGDEDRMRADALRAVAFSVSVASTMETAVNGVSPVDSRQVSRESSSGTKTSTNHKVKASPLSEPQQSDYEKYGFLYMQSNEYRKSLAHLPGQSSKDLEGAMHSNRSLIFDPSASSSHFRIPHSKSVCLPPKQDPSLQPRPHRLAEFSILNEDKSTDSRLFGRSSEVLKSGSLTNANASQTVIATTGTCNPLRSASRIKSSPAPGSLQYKPGMRRHSDMADVIAMRKYCAEQDKLSKPVAMKTTSPAISSDVMSKIRSEFSYMDTEEYKQSSSSMS
ncbi:hypothetical protein HDU67_003129 [Dinochytrium kinnereticum]|nr:hypothetical protein HDU67_003129 [Dinochytrium kinnereticum]